MKLLLAINRGEQLTNELLKIYYQRDVLNAEKECFNMFMVKSALFRVAGPLMEGNANLNKRFDILRKVINTI